MTPALLSLFLLTAPPAAPLQCGHGHTLRLTETTFAFFRGGRAVSKPHTFLPMDTPRSCAVLPAQGLFTTTGTRRTTLFTLERGSLRILTHVFAPGFDTAENVERFDPDRAMLYRAVSALSPCRGDTEVRSFRSVYDKKRKAFVPLEGTSLVPPKGLPRVTALPGPLPGAGKGSFIPFTPTGVSSWRGDRATGDYEPPAPVRLTDLDPSTAWVAGSQSGKGTYINFSRTHTPYPVTGLRIFPGHYGSEKTLAAFPRLKRFALYNQAGRGYEVIIPRDPISRKGSATVPYHVRFPAPLKADCLTLVILEWYPAKTVNTRKPQTPKPPLALSEVTFFSTIDQVRDPLPLVMNDFIAQRLSWTAAARILHRLSDTQLASAFQKASTADFKRLVLDEAVNRKDPRFLPWLVDALPWARGEFLARLSRRLSTPAGASLLERFVTDRRLDPQLRRQAMVIYLKGKAPTLATLLTVMGTGDSRDHVARRIVAKSVAPKDRRDLVTAGCAKADIYRYSGFLWLFARWTMQDPSLSTALTPCLTHGAGKSFTQRMRYLFAAERCPSCGLLKHVSALFKTDPRAPIKARAVTSAARMPGGETLVTEALSSENPLVRAAAVTATRPGRLPLERFADLASVVPELSGAVRSYLLKHCDVRSVPTLKKAIGQRTRWPGLLHILEECRFTTLSPSVYKAFAEEKDLLGRARLALSLARLGHTASRPTILALLDTTLKEVLQDPTLGKKAYAAGLFLEALTSYTQKPSAVFWRRLLAHPLPRALWPVVVRFAGQDCPAVLKNLGPHVADGHGRRVWRALGRTCGWPRIR